jgi:hypothetical protein
MVRQVDAHELLSSLLQFFRNGTRSVEAGLVRLSESLARLLGIGGFQLFHL